MVANRFMHIPKPIAQFPMLLPKLRFPAALLILFATAGAGALATGQSTTSVAQTGGSHFQHQTNPRSLAHVQARDPKGGGGKISVGKGKGKGKNTRSKYKKLKECCPKK